METDTTNEFTKGQGFFTPGSFVPDEFETITVDGTLDKLEVTQSQKDENLYNVKAKYSYVDDELNTHTEYIFVGQFDTVRMLNGANNSDLDAKQIQRLQIKNGFFKDLAAALGVTVTVTTKKGKEVEYGDVAALLNDPDAVAGRPLRAKLVAGWSDPSKPEFKTFYKPKAE